MGSKQDKWVIVFLIYADFVDKKSLSFNSRLAEELDGMLSDILNSPFDNNKVSKYVIFSSVNYINQNSSPEVFADSSTFLFEIIQDSANCNTFSFVSEYQSESRTIEDFVNGRYSIQKVNILEHVFLKVKEIERAASYKTMLLTWDHGSAFGIFRTANIQLTRIFNWQDIIKMQGFYAIKRLIQCIDQIKKLDTTIYSDKTLLIENDAFAFRKKFITEEFIQQEASESNKNKIDSGTVGNAEILTNEELRDAIHGSFANIDLLVMMNCIMMNIHSAFTFKSCVDYFVAPQGIINTPGYNYKKILYKAYIDNPTPKDLADYCITSCFDFTDYRRLEYKDEIITWAIFRLHLKENTFNRLLCLVNHFGNIYSEAAMCENSAIKYLTYYTMKFMYYFDYGVSKYYMTDILNWIRSVNEIITISDFGYEFCEKVNKIYRILKEIVQNKNFIYGIQGSNIYDKNFYGASRLPANGISIYLPHKPDPADETFINFISNQNVPQTDFFKKNPGWLRFINVIAGNN